jgi:hypothetical protein
MDASQIGKRAWSYAGVLQDAGLSCFEYVEQLTLLLFLKMADQLTEEPYNRRPIVPSELGWKALLPLDGAALEDQYRTSLEKLGVKPGMLGAIFKGARCEIHNPALLKQLIVNLLDKVDWLSLPVDVKGTIYASGAVDRRALGLRPTHQPALHTQAEAHPAQGLRRIRRLLPAGPEPRADRHGSRSASRAANGRVNPALQRSSARSRASRREGRSAPAGRRIGGG